MHKKALCFLCDDYDYRYEDILRKSDKTNNKKDKQKLKQGRKAIEITKDVKLVKTDISVWPYTNHLMSNLLL